MAKHKTKPQDIETPREAEEPVDEQAADETGEQVQELELSEDAANLVEELQIQRDEAVAARQRAMADFLNYQRRARENEVRAAREGVSTVVRSLLPVLDHFDLALNQDAEQLTVEQLMDGLRIVRGELAKALQSHKVSPIEPAVGAEFNPNLHQAVMRQPTDEQEPNTIVNVLQLGYAVDDVVLRPASVVVAAAPEGEEE
jgi:molecular chaperone GrpE